MFQFDCVTFTYVYIPICMYLNTIHLFTDMLTVYLLLNCWKHFLRCTLQIISFWMMKLIRTRSKAPISNMKRLRIVSIKNYNCLCSCAALITMRSLTRTRWVEQLRAAEIVIQHYYARSTLAHYNLQFSTALRGSQKTKILH